MRTLTLHPAPATTGNLQPLLHEIKHALLSLLTRDEETTIDLRAMPLTKGEEQQLLDVLGQGEVQAELNDIGKSTVYETRYAGIWVCTHYDEDNGILCRFIEITPLPQLLASHPDDVAESHQRLTELLDRGSLLAH